MVVPAPAVVTEPPPLMTPLIVKELLVEFCVMVRGFVRTKGQEITCAASVALTIVIAAAPPLPCKLRLFVDTGAIVYANEVLEKDSLHFEGLTYKSLLYLSQHHFAEGLALAEKARTAIPDNAFVHGILVDGHVEMGNYTAAVEEAEKMIYSRSFQKKIHFLLYGKSFARHCFAAVAPLPVGWFFLKRRTSVALYPIYTPKPFNLF